MKITLKVIVAFLWRSKIIIVANRLSRATDRPLLGSEFAIIGPTRPGTQSTYFGSGLKISEQPALQHKTKSACAYIYICICIYIYVVYAYVYIYIPIYDLDLHAHACVYTHIL